MSEQTNQNPPQVTEQASSTQSTEDVVSKYKRLLSMARSSLEANQVDMKEKDKYISQLKQALDDEKSKDRSKRSNNKDDEASIPRSLLRRVDVDKKIWILIEYELTADGRNVEDKWIVFSNEEDLDDFVQRIPGVPLVKPNRSLTPSESAQIEAESKKKVDRIVEEFRRFKVKFEIARKQKDSENKLSYSRSPLSPGVSFDMHDVNSSQNQDEINRLQNLLNEQELKWKTAYEKVVKDNEILRNRGTEALLATQWRERYETCLKERDELSEKLKVYMMKTEGSGLNGKSVEQVYLDLKEEYKEFRKRFLAFQEQREIEHEELRQRGIVLRGNSSNATGSTGPNNNVLGNNSGSGVTYSESNQNSIELQSVPSTSMQQSKMLYIKQMVFQYLICRDPEVKLHVENALIAIFRFNETEKSAISETKKSEDVDTLTSITRFLGSLNG